MQLRNKLHPFMLSPDNLSMLAKKYGHFQRQISLETFCRDISKFTQFQPWQLHQALFKLLNTQTISWSAFLELLKDDCSTRSTLINQLIDHNKSYSIQLKEDYYSIINSKFKLAQEQYIRQFNKIALIQCTYSIFMLNSQLLIAQEKDNTIISKICFNPIPQERKTIIDKHQLNIQLQRGKIQLPSQILNQGLRKSIKISSDRIRKSQKPDKKITSVINDLSLNESFQLGIPLTNDAFQSTIKFNSSHIRSVDHPSVMKTQFDPWVFMNKMKTLKSQLAYNPNRLPLDRRFKSTYVPKEKQTFNRAETLNKKIATSNIPISSFSVDMDYVAVILTNKQLRLMKLKKYSFNKIVTNIVLVKSFKWYPIYIHLFRTILNDNLHILIAFQSEKITKLRVYKLVYEKHKDKQQTQAKLQQIYSQQIGFSPIFQQMDGHLAMFNEFGQMIVLDLTCRDHDTISMKINIKIQNPFLNKTIPISACTYHHQTFTIVIGCKNGYLHTLSQHSPQPKRHKKIADNGQVTSLVCGYEYVIVLTTNQICLLVNPYSLNQMNRIDLKKFDLKKVNRMFKIQNKDQIIIYGKVLQKIHLVVNQQKIKQIRKNKYHHLNKVQLLDNKAMPVEKITDDTVCKVKVTQDHLVIILEKSNLVKVFSSLRKSISFIPNKQTTTIIDVALQKKGNLIAIAYDSFDIQVINIFSQNVSWSVTLNDFPNCLIFIIKDHTSFVNVNTQQGNVNLIDSQGALKTIYTTKTSLTTTIQIRNNLVIGDAQGSLFVFSETSMKLLHKINISTGIGIKLMKDLPKQKFVRVLTEENEIIDIDIQNAKIIHTFSLKNDTSQIIHDVTQTGFIQEGIKGIFVGQLDQKLVKQRLTINSRSSPIRRKHTSTPTVQQTLKSLRPINTNKASQQQTFKSFQYLISYNELTIQRDKIKHVQMAMNRLVIVMNNSTIIYIDNNKNRQIVNLLN